VVDIDAGQISQVVNNLLINAMQAMPGGGTVTLRGRNTLGRTHDMPRDRYVTIEVIDHGVGISPENLGRIFDPYFSTKAEGRGLGLASAYSVVRHHDGTLTALSEEGRGTTFRILLPASETRWVPPTGEDLEMLQSKAADGGRILIMDDDETVLRLTAAMVEELGYETELAIDGQTAITSYRRALTGRQPFDAVIMDLTIPGGMGGKEAMKHLREIDPHVVAIVASGYSNDPVMADFRGHGFAAQLSKPFRVEDLDRALKRIPGTPYDREERTVGVT
jgi:CheY-like chemotaxis protein